MKQKLFAVILLVVVISFVTINTIVIDRQIEEIMTGVEEVDINSENAEDDILRIFEDFKRKERYISLTVNHDDLTNIEDCFVSLVGYLSVGNTDEAEVTRNRLTNSLEHLKRLSTFTIDAII